MFKLDLTEVLAGLTILCILGYLAFKHNIDENILFAKQSWRHSKLIGQYTFLECQKEDETCFANKLNELNFFSAATDVYHYESIKKQFCKTQAVDCLVKFELFFWNQFDLQKLNLPLNPDWEKKIQIVFNLKQITYALERRLQALKSYKEPKSHNLRKAIERVEDIQSNINIRYPHWLEWQQCIKASSAKEKARICLDAK